MEPGLAGKCTIITGGSGVNITSNSAPDAVRTSSGGD